MIYDMFYNFVIEEMASDFGFWLLNPGTELSQIVDIQEGDYWDISTFRHFDSCNTTPELLTRT